MESQHKQFMQENMQKIFMKQVCALNIEAMNLFNPSSVDGQNFSQMEDQLKAIT